MTTALITGATAGIGREFADQLAAAGHDLVLVARDTARLELVRSEIEDEHEVDVEVLTADLSDRAQLQRVADRLADDARPVDILVNNAGYGLRKSFLQNEIAVEEQLFDVLCRAVLVLSHAAGRAMKGRGTGSIINVSSVAGFLAAGTYSAEKSFVTVFSEGLASELEPHGVQVTALCPGFTRTEFHERASLRMTLPDFAWLDKRDLVATCLKDVAAGRTVSVPGLQYKAAATALRLLPRGVVRKGGLVQKKKRRG
ncbi:SDR family NAD(P)-dependent oxidoreductase [Janibacter sp. G1551]|uniref:SDR family NAD(P)-dependent oxidoreductase n=1 Tax=Janibacter sp. G1551 TaxID=3420440 RepID=UPI003CFCC565